MLNTLYFCILGTVCFFIFLPIFSYLSKYSLTEYKIGKDPWVYMWGGSFLVVSILYFVLPDMQDIIVDVEYKNIFISFILAALIYIAYVVEIKWLLSSLIVISAAVITYLIPDNVLIFEKQIPFVYDRLIVFSVILLVTFFAKILNGMSAIFGIFMLTGLCGSVLVSLVGGLPLAYGFIASALVGLWFAFLRYNWYPSEVELSDGACCSAAFLLCCFFVCASCEFAGPSVLVLLAYIFAEILWVVVRTYILRIKEPYLSNNTAYYSSYVKDINIYAILVSVAKIGVINIIFSAFQVYSINSFSIPVFSLVVNLWLLNMLYNAGEKELTLKETNEAIINEVKNSIKTIGDTFKKGK